MQPLHEWLAGYGIRTFKEFCAAMGPTTTSEVQGLRNLYYGYQKRMGVKWIARLADRLAACGYGDPNDLRLELLRRAEQSLDDSASTAECLA